MKIKKFLLPIWWNNRGLFPLGNKYFWVFVLNGLTCPSHNYVLTYMLSAENQKGVNAIQQFSIENQKGAIAIDFVQR